MLLLALMLMLSFNLSQALHSKIRLQQHSDAMAYSMAVVEARTFNYLAYSNRAIAAAYVSNASLHAYMAAASVTADMMDTAKFNFYIIAIQELALCCSCGGPIPCCKFQHCIHAWQAFRIARKFGQEARKYGNRVKGLEITFEITIWALDWMIDFIHTSQLLMINHARDVLAGGQLDALRNTNAPQASGLHGSMGWLNAGSMICALEGLGIPCPLTSEAGHQSRKKVMTEVANASRPKWVTRRPPLIPLFPIHLHPSFLMDLMRDIQGDGISLPLFHKGGGKIMQGQSRSAIHSGQQGTTGSVVGAGEHGWLFSQWKHGFMAWKYDSEIYSSREQGGKHKPSKTHAFGHKRHEGVARGSGLASCILRGNCFIKYRATSKKERDFGQPKVYSYVTQDLSRMQGGGRGAWEINDKGIVKLGHGAQGTGTLNLRPGEGAAMSKAMVYYHRFGNWREHPNLFNPYWRAKLHPFTRMEAMLVAGAAGNADAAAISMVPGAPLN